MSFSSNIKKQILEEEIKKQCCRDCIEAGKALLPFTPKCDKDNGMYLRGVFLTHGSISAPGRNFMLSFLLPDEKTADFISNMLEAVILPPKRTLRRGKPLVYYKASDCIEDTLSFMGATRATLSIADARIMNDVRNNTNRLCNAETANLDRAAKAAAEQNEAIRIIQRHGALQNLPFELRECAELRLANPDMSLAQLRVLMREPVSKSGLNHRFRKLIEIAETLKN